MDPITQSCCGYDDPLYAPEAFARRDLFKRTGFAMGAAALAPGLTPMLAQAQAPAAPVREIAQIGGNLYRFRNNFHFSVFAVTAQGAIVTDPINADAAGWLRAQIRERFNQPVRYLIYSHDHPDHISGGEGFGDGVTTIAHERCKAKIVGERRRTPVPNIVFSDAMTLELAGTVVELEYAGRNHSDNSIVVRSPAQRALFAVDFIPVESLAFRDLHEGYVEEWIDSLKRVEAMDFDVLLPGHGPVGRKSHVRDFRVYLETVADGVLDGMRRGQSLEQIRDAMRLERYASWMGYEQMRALNIEGMHRYWTVFSRRTPA
jgi:glyoxylase-like metal-dependent hydrolase (beta-lactamase superfamily II)